MWDWRARFLGTLLVQHWGTLQLAWACRWRCRADRRASWCCRKDRRHCTDGMDLQEDAGGLLEPEELEVLRTKAGAGRAGLERCWRNWRLFLRAARTASRFRRNARRRECRRSVRGRDCCDSLDSLGRGYPSTSTSGQTLRTRTRGRRGRGWSGGRAARAASAIGAIRQSETETVSPGALCCGLGILCPSHDRGSHERDEPVLSVLLVRRE